jgi:hypothetical protein
MAFARKVAVPDSLAFREVGNGRSETGVGAWRSAGDDVGDPDGREVLTVAAATAHVLAAAELLDNDHLVPELADDLADDLGSGEQGSADGGPAVAGDQENLIEDQFVAVSPFLAVDGDRVAGADPVLVATVFEDCVQWNLVSRSDVSGSV